MRTMVLWRFGVKAPKSWTVPAAFLVTVLLIMTTKTALNARPDLQAQVIQSGT